VQAEALDALDPVILPPAVGGAIDRIAYDASSSGPDVAALNRLRDRIDELRQQGERPPAARVDALLELLPTVPALFSLVTSLSGTVTIAFLLLGLLALLPVPFLLLTDYSAVSSSPTPKAVI